MLLLCSFLRLKELFQVKNGLTTSLPFFENAKNLGRSGRRSTEKNKGMTTHTPKNSEEKNFEE